MPIQDRLYTQDVFHLFLQKANASATIAGEVLADLVSVFTDCKFRAETTMVQRRSIWETTKHPNPVEIGYTIDVGAVVDASYPSLLNIFLYFGPGPYAISLFRPGTPPRAGYAFIVSTEEVAGGEAMHQQMALEVRGDLRFVVR